MHYSYDFDTSVDTSITAHYIEEYVECISIYFERSNSTGFDFAQYEMPQRRWTKLFGFSEVEADELAEYALLNFPLMLDNIREEENGTKST